MLKFKLQTTESEKVINFDKRSSYVDFDITHIATYFFSLYSNKITCLSNIKIEKEGKIREMVNTLIAKKQYYKSLLESTNINMENVSIYRKALKKESIKFMLSVIDNLHKKQDKTINERIDLFIRCSSVIENLNSDISTLNSIRKDFNRYIGYFSNLNIYKDSKAKLTAFDIEMMKEGKLTGNLKSFFYFYLSKLKINQKVKSVSFSTFSYPFRSLISEQDLNEIIKNSVEKSFNSFLQDSVFKKVSNFHNQILDRYF